MKEIQANLNQKSTRDLVARHYAADYKRDLSDSPDETRRDLNRAIMQALREDNVHPRRVLNIGSGPQILERVLMQSYSSGKDPEVLKRTFFATTDFAHIDSHRLKAQKQANVSHVRADAAPSGLGGLPFAPDSFGMVVSNMAMDFIPREVLSEVTVALSDGGLFIFTFHHPDMMRGILADTKDPLVREFVSRGLRDHMYFETADEIRSTLIGHNLIAEEITEKRDSSPHSSSKWWFVRGTKGQTTKA